LAEIAIAVDGDDYSLQRNDNLHAVKARQVHARLLTGNLFAADSENHCSSGVYLPSVR
jgi:hypothetical protein